MNSQNGNSKTPPKKPNKQTEKHLNVSSKGHPEQSENVNFWWKCSIFFHKNFSFLQIS